MILTASMEWSDRPSSNYCLGHWIKKRDSGRQEGAAAEKAVPFSAPLFDPKPLLAFASTSDLTRATYGRSAGGDFSAAGRSAALAQLRRQDHHNASFRGELAPAAKTGKFDC
jgi:hypothetical protein